MTVKRIKKKVSNVSVVDQSLWTLPERFGGVIRVIFWLRWTNMTTRKLYRYSVQIAKNLLVFTLWTLVTCTITGIASTWYTASMMDKRYRQEAEIFKVQMELRRVEGFDNE